MKNMIAAYATYNLEVDNVLLEAFARMTPEELEADKGSYFGSIEAILAHLVRSARYLHHVLGKTSHGAVGDHPSLAEGFEFTLESFEETVAALRDFDRSLLALAGDLEESTFLRHGEIERGSGVIYDLAVWEVFLQYMIHQTHHRGQLSQILDEMGVEHDIGNVWNYYRK